MFKNIKTFYKLIRNQITIQRAKKDKDGLRNFELAELIRNVHSIEKGLSIETPRLGFGHNKQKVMMELISKYYGNDEISTEISMMGLHALREYVDLHKKNGYSDEILDEINSFLNRFSIIDNMKYGGTIDILRSNLYNFDIEEVQKLFSTRHSVRDFDHTPVDEVKLQNALKLAWTAPSACNRQGVRVYVLSHNNTEKVIEYIKGVGGFSEKVDRYIFITGKTSAYRNDEVDQYIVSASIYAAYLTLTLHANEIGSCVVQRTVVWTKEWGKMQKMFNIPKDEQIVLALAVGNLKEGFKVPVSHRLSSIETIHFIG